MTMFIFLLALALVTVTDLFALTIPNLIVIPAAIYGCYVTGNYWYALIVLCVGLALFTLKKVHGGDIKLAVMIAAFLGWKVVPILAIAAGLVVLYRKFFVVESLEIKNIPFAPFCLAGGLLFIWV
jgi:Flp pilus assembly protein protease CpaA